MKKFDEYYNSKPTELTEEELKEWNETHQSQEGKEEGSPE